MLHGQPPSLFEAELVATPLDPLLMHIGRAITDRRGRAFLVGGAVRDHLLGYASSDWDIEVFGLTAPLLVQVLQTFGRVNAVGISFGVLKVHTARGELDVTLARTDNTTGQGRRGFIGRPEAGMTPAAAAARRDFTINAMMQDLASGAILDFYGGRDDLAARILRHTGPAFAEDPLRVLRGMQLAARYNMTIAPETALLCRSLQPAFNDLPVERIWGEWWKWCTRAATPSAGLRLLRACGWRACFPALEALAGCPQDPHRHPEGDVFEHTCCCVDAAAQIAAREALYDDGRAVLVLAALCHDWGKPLCTVLQNGHWRAPGHTRHTAPVLDFLQRIGVPPALQERILPLVREHLVHYNPVTPAAVRRLAQRLGKATITELVWLIEADYRGRPPGPPQLPQAVTDLLNTARAQHVTRTPPAPILMGRHLLPLGLPPGPALGRLLRRAYQAQLDGTFADLDGAQAWLAETLQSP